MMGNEGRLTSVRCYPVPPMPGFSARHNRSKVRRHSTSASAEARPCETRFHFFKASRWPKCPAVGPTNQDRRSTAFHRSPWRSSMRRRTTSPCTGSGGGRATRCSFGAPEGGVLKGRPPACQGTIRSIGVLRSRIVSERPARTLRRCSLKRLFKSAIRTFDIVTFSYLWSS